MSVKKKQPTVQEFDELIEKAVEARDMIGLTPEQFRARAEKKWPADVVRQAMREARDRQ
jgi:hypothetical protein